MGRSYLVDGLAWFAILSWIGSSIYLAANGYPDMFQRFGAFGIVIGVIYYAVVPPPVVHPVGHIEAQAWRDKTAIEVFNGVAVANMNVSLLAASLQKKIEDEGKDAPQSIVALAKPARDLTVAGKSYPEPINRDSEIDTNSADMDAADKNAASVERTRFLTQAILVVVGTLQSGFGSMFVIAG